jgi:hypothetical protein
MIMQYFFTIFLFIFSVSLYAEPLPSISKKSFLSNASSNDDCCDEDGTEDDDEDVIIMDEEDSNEDEGVNNTDSRK